MSASSIFPRYSSPQAARHEIERKLGEGGAGAVYLVRDRETGEQLALKKLFRVDAKSVLRLKREFRSMQAINHPNIVKLYDMGQADDSWFLTMEYLDGADFKSYLHGAQQAQDAAASACSPRLLSTFHQLARGVHALHEAGLLHRDLKPSNVLVVDHRAVVLDFGLVRELSLAASKVTEDGAVAGTPAYMAPEQIAAKELSAATDWYAFGAMLYEAVSGLLPFDGSIMELLRAKLESDPVPLDRLVPEVPRWVCDLCNALLQRDPARRPSGAEVIVWFDSAQPATRKQSGPENVMLTETRFAPSELFGRTRETSQLWRAFAQLASGGAQVVQVRGESGAGKSALIEHFLEQLALRAEPSNGGALVLRSRCYELEAMPFKALDGVMDAVTHHLSRLEDIEVAHILPSDIGVLSQVFPVLQRLAAVRRLATPASSALDALQRLGRAEVALRMLLDKLAARAPIVLWIDDLQWGDLDSARILKSWLARPSTAPLLFIFSYRSDEVGTSTFLRTLLDADAERASHAAEHSIDIVALDAPHIRALCEQRLPLQIQGRAELIERVVRDAQGSPFLASQLLALVLAKSIRGDVDLQSVSIDLMVAQTSALLAADAQQLLAVLAIAGRPMAPKLAMQAAGIKHGGRRIVHDLRALNLVRTREVGGARMVEVYHDRIRERIQDTLSAGERQAIQQRLFTTIELSGWTEPGWLHTLALGAGQVREALHYGNAAAERANASLAFERAAGLYRKCIELVPAAEAGELWSKLSSALARCGRGVEAAEASLEAGRHAPDKALAWLQRAASHLLRSGHFTQGEELVRQVLAARQIALPTSAAGIRAAVAWERARIRLHGKQDKLRSGEECPPELLERCDLLTALFIDTHPYDWQRAVLFQVRALRCALEAGEPTRLMRALTTASLAAALYGSAHAAAEADELLARAAAINAKLAVPDEQTMNVTRAVNAYALGRLHEVLAPSDEAGRLLRSDAQQAPSGNYNRRFGVASIRIAAMQAFGQYARCAGELHGLVDEAMATDNRSLSLLLTRSLTLADQVEGHAARSQPRLVAQRDQLPPHCFGLLHVLHMVSVMSTARWTEDYAWANAYLAAVWPEFLDSPVRATAYLGLMAHSEHAHLVLNQYGAQTRGGEASRMLSKDIRALARSPLPAAAAFAERYRARAAFLAGDASEAATRLRASLSAFEALGMAHEAARDQFALGAVLRGEQGLLLRSAAEQRLRDIGVVEPSADVRAHCPELIGAG